MREKTLKGIFACIAIAVTAGGCGGSERQRVQFISIATASVGGAFSVVGTAMADIITRNVEGVNANVEITGGSAENILLVERGAAEFGMSASDVLFFALNGQGTFAGQNVSDVRGVMGGHLTTFQVYVLADSGINSFSDLRGRRVSVGPPGSVGIDSMILVMNYYGMEINVDWIPEYLSHADGAEALTDKNVDAVVIVITVPASAIHTAASQRPVRLLELEPEIYNRLLADNPYYLPSNVPAGTYRGMDVAIERTFAAPSLMLTHASISEDLVFKFIQTIYDNLDELTRAYPQASEWNPENITRGLEGIVEMHPGAIRYMQGR